MSVYTILCLLAFAVLNVQADKGRRIWFDSTLPPKCIDVARGSITSGTAVQLADCNGGPAQNWIFDVSDPNRATFIKIWSGNVRQYCLEINDRKEAIVNFCNENNPRQKWFGQLDDIWWSFRTADPALSNWILQTVVGWHDGARVAMQPRRGKDHLWRIENDQEGWPLKVPQW